MTSSLRVCYTCAMKDKIEQYLAYIKSKGLADNTILAYRQNLSKYLNFVTTTSTDYLNISRTELNTFIESVDNTISFSSISHLISTLKSFYKYLVKESLTKFNPIELLDAPKLPKRLPSFFSEGEVKLILTQIPTTPFNGVRNRTIIQLLYSSGLRISEAINLRISDIDLKQGVLHCIGKGNKERIVPLSKPAITSIREYLKLREQFAKSDYLFVSQEGSSLSRQYLWKSIKEYISSAKISKGSPHTFRHAFATTLLDSGADINSIKEMMGHSSIATTQIYTHVNQNKLKTVHQNCFK